MTSQIEDALQKLRDSIQPNNPKQQRAAEIAEFIINQAEATSKDLVDIAKYSRKVPRIARKIKFSKRELNRKVASTGFRSYISAFHLCQITAKPIPKFPAGGQPSSGVTYINEIGRETFINPLPSVLN